MLPRSPWRTRGPSCLVAAAVAALVLAGRPAGGGRPERPARRHVRRARQPGAGRAAAARGRGADRAAGAAGRGGRRPRTRSTQAQQAVADAAEGRRRRPGRARRLPGGGGRLRVGALPGRRRPDAAHPPALRRRPRRRVGGDELPGRRRRARRRGDRCRGDQRQAALDAAAAGDGGTRPGQGASGRGRRPRWPSWRRRPTAVTDELDAALGDVDKQLGPAAEGAGRRQHADGGQLAGLRRPADRGRRGPTPRRSAGGRRRPGCPSAWCRSRPPGGERSEERHSCRASPARCWSCRPRRSPR